MPRSPFRSRPQLRKRLIRQLPMFLEQATEQVTSEVPIYQQLRSSEIGEEVHHVIAQNLQLFARLLEEGRLPEPGEIEFMMRSAANRAEERIPLPEVLAAYYSGFRFFWQRLDTTAEAADLEEVIEIGSLVLSYLQTVTSAVTDAYVETTTALTGSAREARNALLERMLRAEDTEESWHAVGLAPWGRRTVVALRHPAPDWPDTVTVAVEARRRTRAVREALVEITGAETLDALTSTGGVVVLRGDVAAEELGKALGDVLHDTWYAGLAVAADSAATPEAASAARDCAEVADRLGYAAGVHQLKDLLLEVQVTRPGPARQALCDLLAPLTAHHELMATLAAYVGEGGRRAQTARRLHVHPNTLDYRLRRIRELTGVDPSDRDGGQLVRAALVVREFLEGPVER